MQTQTNIDKKRIQVNIDRLTAERADKVFKGLGINPTTAINALYTKTVALGKLPFELELTQRQKDELALQELITKIPVKNLETQEELEEFFREEY